MESVKVFAPATVANVGCGFDILGFALNNPGDEIIVSKKSTPGITIVNKTNLKLPLDPEKNTSGIAVIKYLEYIHSNQGFEITFISKIAPGSGIGSSAASSVGALFGANTLLNSPLAPIDLVQFAMHGERVASGTAHADNVAPAMLGGFVLIRSYSPLDIIKIEFPDNLYAAVVHPQIEVRTEDARKILMQNIPLKNAISQWGNTAGLIAGLMKGDYNLIGRSLEDFIIEPIRSILIPGFKDVKSAAMANGALGCSISGSGPSIFTLNEGKETAERVGAAMKERFENLGLDCHCHISSINKVGPHIC